MQLSKRTQYGLRAAVRLAVLHPRGTYAQSRDLADSEQLPTKFLEQVLLGLRRASLLESKVGSGGGYRLRRPPEEITVRQVLEALEPTDEADAVPSTVGGRAVEMVAEQLAQQQNTLCDEWTLAKLAEDAAQVAGAGEAMYHI
ncbi:MAG: Rrf2 family transcriptional regulator [Planctomycetota bacterium]